MRADGKVAPDFLFSRVVNVHFQEKNGRLLLDFMSTIVVDGAIQPPCAVPTFFPAGAKLLDKIEKCTKTTIPEHTDVVRTYFAWSPLAAAPTPSNYNTVLHTNGGLDVMYGAQFSQEISFGGPFSLVSTFSSLHPSANGFYPTYAACQSYCNELNAFAPLDTMQRWFDEFNVIQGPVPRVLFGPQFVDASFVVPARSRAVFQGRYLFSVPETLNDMIAAVVGSDDSSVLARTFHQNVTKISQLKGAPDYTATISWADNVDYRVTTFKASPKTWRVTLQAGPHISGG